MEHLSSQVEHNQDQQVQWLREKVQEIYSLSMHVGFAIVNMMYLYISISIIHRIIKMPRYIILLNWTAQGIKNAKDTVKRAKSFENAIEKAGGKSLGLYYTMGRHDMVAMVEAPNDEAIASVLYSTGSLGNVHTETLKAFSMDEAANIIEKLT
jgi:uncharacterized protein with GYD domain